MIHNNFSSFCKYTENCIIVLTKGRKCRYVSYSIDNRLGRLNRLSWLRNNHFGFILFWIYIWKSIRLILSFGHISSENLDMPCCMFKSISHFIQLLSCTGWNRNRLIFQYCCNHNSASHITFSGQRHGISFRIHCLEIKNVFIKLQSLPLSHDNSLLIVSEILAKPNFLIIINLRIVVFIYFCWNGLLCFGFFFQCCV